MFIIAPAAGTALAAGVVYRLFGMTTDPGAVMRFVIPLLLLVPTVLAAQDAVDRGARDCRPEPGQEVTEPVRRRQAVPPVYPAGLREQGLTASVRVRFVVCSDGAVDSATVTFVKSIDPRFDEAAVRSVRATTYHPARRNGVRVAQIVESLVRFTPPEDRVVDGAVLTSTALPRERITLDPSLTYVGTQVVPLGGGVEGEQHFWIDADGQAITRFLWLQFEGKPAGSLPYNYASDSLVIHQGIPFRVAFRYYPPSGLSDPPGSDGERARARVESEGYRFGAGLARVRLVWLLDEPPLNEMMAIYVEDLAAHGLTLDSLEAEPARWEQFKEGILQRALATMQIDQP